jgi:hypothetical protein
MTPDEVQEILDLQDPRTSVVPFSSMFLNMMKLGPSDKGMLTQIPGYKEFLDEASRIGYGYCVIDEGRPIVCFGIIMQWPHVAECWLIPDTERIKVWRHRFHKGSLRFFEEAASRLDLHRIHVTVDVDNPVALKWITRMKFKKEAVLQKYSYNEKDMVMYSRLFVR